MANGTYCYSWPLTPEGHRCSQKVTSVDSELMMFPSTMDLAKTWAARELAGAKAGSALRKPRRAKRVYCFLGDVSGGTEIFAFSVRIRAHYSL